MNATDQTKSDQTNSKITEQSTAATEAKPEKKESEKEKVTSSPASTLTWKEREQVRESIRHRPAVVYEIIRLQGEAELRRPHSALWWSGVAAAQPPLYGPWSP